MEQQYVLSQYSSIRVIQSKIITGNTAIFHRRWSSAQEHLPKITFYSIIFMLLLQMAMMMTTTVMMMMIIVIIIIMNEDKVHCAENVHPVPQALGRLATDSASSSSSSLLSSSLSSYSSSSSSSSASSFSYAGKLI